MKKYIIPDLPPTDNHTYLQRGKIRFMTQIAKDWKYNAGLIVNSQYKNKPSVTDVIFGEIHIYLKRDRDIQGSLKVFFDSFEGILYDNDRRIRKFGPVFKHSDRANPRIEFFF